MNNGKGERRLTIATLILFLLSWAAVPIVRFSSCRSQDYSFIERYEFVEPEDQEPKKSRKPRQGAFFPGSVRKTARVVLYSNLYQCLYLERWRRPAHGRWSRDDRGGLESIWIQFGEDLQLLDRVYCDAASGHLPDPWAISKNGDKVAWIWEGIEDGADKKYLLKVADMRDVHRSSFEPDAAVTTTPLPVQPPFHGLTFIDEDRLLLWYGQDRALVWDSHTKAKIADDPLVRGATALDANEELIASSNFSRRTLGLTRIGSGRVDDEYVLQLIQSDKQEGTSQPGVTGRKGSALALGPGGLAALASTEGTFALLAMEEGDANIVLNDTPIERFGTAVTQVTWIDAEHIAFAGEVAALYVAKLEFTNHRERVGVDDVYELALQEIPDGMQWISYDALSGLLVYGTEDSVFVGELSPHCTYTDWGTLFGIPFGMASVLALLWALALSLRKRGR